MGLASQKPLPRLIVSMVLGLCAAAHGIVISIDAQIRTESQELQSDGVVLQSDEAFEEFRVTASELPIGVLSSLETPAGDGRIETLAQGAVDFRDPTLVADSPNPREFGLEAECYSADPAKRCEVSNLAIERRVVQFSAAELGLIGSPGSRNVRSRFFVNGAGVLWSADSMRNLRGTSLLIRVRVIQELPSGEERAVLDSSVKVQGRSDGEFDLTTEGSIAVVFQPLAQLIESVPALAEFIGVDFSGLGLPRVLLIPDQALPYTYLAAVDETFNLRAEISVEATSSPNETGVGIVMGRPFQNLADVVDRIAFPSVGAKLQSAVNLAQESSGPSPSRKPAACGTFGAEALGMLALAICPSLVRRRARAS